MATVRKKPLRYGLYGEEDFLRPDFMHCQTMEFRPEIKDRIIKEHIHTSLFQVFFVEQGRLDFIIENTKRIVKGPAIVTIPENTLHGMKGHKGLAGKVLTLSTSFLEILFKNSTQALLELSSTQFLTESDNNSSFKIIGQIIDNLNHEIKESLPEKKLVIQSYFSLILSLIYRLLKKRAEKLVTTDNRDTRYFAHFQKSVKQSYTPMKSVKQYASELNITSVHLNRICRATVCKSALQIIHDFLILEAEKFLTHTDYSISEIAYRLNFDDPAYFSRFFSKYVGVSPKNYRTKS
ncbi:MAG: helix-turn-helix domain-containing protein [Chitinophagaceae bacterium]|nr:helix-turn-helix domain-containing protein [Chitinophagaceae bacterium]